MQPVDSAASPPINSGAVRWMARLMISWTVIAFSGDIIQRFDQPTPLGPYFGWQVLLLGLGFATAVGAAFILQGSRRAAELTLRLCLLAAAVRLLVPFILGGRVPLIAVGGAAVYALFAKVLYRRLNEAGA